MSAAEVIGEALDLHRYNIGGSCNGCDWVATDESAAGFREQHRAHLASVIAALPDIAIVQVPPMADGDTLMPPETLMQRIKSDGAMFQVGFQAAIEENVAAGGES